MTSDEYVRTSDAAQYWNGFPADWRPTDKGEVLVGTVDQLSERRGFDGSKLAVVRVRTDDGDQVNVVAAHVHLLLAFKQLQPRIGDRIKLQYLGQDTQAAPGFKPPHRYQVAVRDGVTGEKR